VTKVADLTDFDRVGIPNFLTVRPYDLGPGLSYYNGKGTTRADAYAGALMEAIERHAGERHAGPIVAASHYNLRYQHACVDPAEIVAPMVCGYHEHLRLEWVSGFDLLSRRETFAPLNCVIAPYDSYTSTTLFLSSTNGLASGNTRCEALCHALCEVIERDAMGLSLARTHVRPAVARLLSNIGFRLALPERKDAPPISLRGLPKRAAALVGKLQRAGLEVQLRNLTSETGIPTIGCTIAEPHGPQLFVNAHSGCGTHPDARIALTRALTEAAQTRLACIQGGREDLPDFVGPPGTPRAPRSHADGPTINFSDIASYQHPSINEDVEFILDRLRQSGFAQVVVFDITRAEVGIPVVRVLVPHAEAWTLFFVHSGRAALGPRALAQIRDE